MNEKKVKQSYGIACVKYIEGRLHVLMVKKKYTYAFFEFVFAKYPKFDRRYLEGLFNYMTFQEKMDILEMSFDKLWKKIIINVPDDPHGINRSRIKFKKPFGKKKYELVFTDSIVGDIDEYTETEMTSREKEYSTYVNKRQRFEELIEDGGKMLREVIAYSKSSDPIWEIPKGRPDDDEKPLNTAIREFHEETTATIENYKILHDIDPIKVSYMNGCYLYNNEYYIARMDDWNLPTSFQIYEHNREIEELRWVNTDEIRFLNRNQYTYKRMIDVMHKIKSVMRLYKSQS